jgi:hypothetical protein
MGEPPRIETASVRCTWLVTSAFASGRSISPAALTGFAKAWMNVYRVLGCEAENNAADPLPLMREYVYER